MPQPPPEISEMDVDGPTDRSDEAVRTKGSCEGSASPILSVSPV